MSAVAKRYARALFEVASENQTIDTTETELNQITDIIAQDAEFRAILTHPKITAAEKTDMLNTLFAGKVSETTLVFLGLVINRGREESFSDIAQNFTELANEVRGYADAIVTTAKSLTEEEAQAIAAQFGAKLNKKLRVTTKVDPSIIGGMMVRIGDRMYDGSIKGKLSRFTQQIKQAQV
ncbi:F0F1 ATP synthase subunit delta [Aneurinibacillus uraniidurans]|uniref:F0F1 ATP synthase subunit delta n=1 Tax=Aneurinibacillus uraniidurans TaxID=2966586 RepID=UPI00234B5277|nr:F0F1 ATP synthase subunit delta [Aneurinibacillus sp. B1]WCN38060.1 F0F1 ATP synthase subunit delta [Aneurinibacillus sp. B1]